MKKKLEIFFRNCFEVFGKSHSVEKCKRGDPLGFFEHPFCCKIEKIEGGPFGGEKHRLKNEILLFSDPHFQSGGKSSSVLRFFSKFCQISTLHHLII